MTNTFKIIILVVVAIIICVISGVVIGTTNSGKAMVNNSTTQIKDVAKNNGNIVEATYDGNTLLGSEIVSLIKSTIENKDRLSIVVNTLIGSRTDYNFIYDESTNAISSGGTTVVAESKSSDNYINRDSLYKCSVKKDINDVIICLWFNQR